MSKSNKPKLSIIKPVRLLDFVIYDESPEKEDESSGSDEQYDSKPQYKKDDSDFVIQMFGIDELGKTYSITVKDFQPFFFVKVGNNWNQSTVNGFISFIQEQIGKYYRESIESCSLVEYNKLYGFSAGKMDKFLKMVFKNSATMNKVKNLWFEYMESETGERIRKPKYFVYDKTELVYTKALYHLF